MVLSARQFLIRLALALAVTLALSVAFQSWAHAQQRRVTINFMTRGGHTYQQLLQELVDEFEKQHPHIRVQITPEAGDFNDKLAVLMATGLAPDVAFIDANNFRPFVEAGQFMNLSEMIERDPDFYPTDYFPWALDSLRYKGDLYALPYDGGTYALYYNQDHFDLAGMGYPDDQWTVWDLQDAAKKLTVRGPEHIERFGVDLNGWSFWLWVWAFGGEVLAPDNSRTLLGEPPAVEALEWMADLMLQDESMYNYSYSLPFEVSFPSQRVSMVTYGYWFVSDYRQVDFNWDVAPIPRGHVRAGLGWYSGFAIPKGARHPEEAWEFVRWLTSEEANRKIASLGVAMPAMISVAASPDFQDATPPNNNLAWYQFAESVRIPPYHARFEEMQNEIMYPELMKAWMGQQSVTNALENIIPRVDALLATLP